MRISGDAEGVEDRLEHLGGSSIERRQVPPAASIFSCAAALKACALDGQLLRDLAAGEDLDRVRGAWRGPASRSVSGVTSAPASKRSSRSARLTGCVWVRNCSNGIDFFMCGPRSLRIRMWIGFWPPS